MKIMSIGLADNTKNIHSSINKTQLNVFFKNNAYDSVSFTSVKENTKDELPLSYDPVSKTTYKNDTEVPKKAIGILSEMSSKANKIIDMANNINKKADDYRKTILYVNNKKDATYQNGMDIKISSGAKYKKGFNGLYSKNEEVANGTLVDINMPEKNFNIHGMIDENTGHVVWITTSEFVNSSSCEDSNTGDIVHTKYNFQENGQLKKYERVRQGKEGGDCAPIKSFITMEFLANQIRYKKEENGKKVQIAELLLEDEGFLRNALFEDNEGSMRKRTEIIDKGRLCSSVKINGEPYLNIDLRDENFQEDDNAVPVGPKYSPKLSSEEFRSRTFSWYM